MTLPRLDTKITIDTIIMVCIYVGGVVWYISTDHTRLVAHEEKITTIHNKVAMHETSITKLEEWKAIGPRFTPTDATNLKLETIRDASRYTDDKMTRIDAKLDDINRVLTELKVMMAKQR